MLTRIPIIRHLRNRPRFAAAILFGVVLWAILSVAVPWAPTTRLLVAWDAAIVFYLAALSLMAGADTADIKKRAAQEDEGRMLILAFSVITASASVIAILSELTAAKQLHGAPQGLHIGLVVATVILSWTFMQVMFGLHYAHAYYADGQDPADPALQFPGKAAPNYWDFLYFSLILGTAAQTADVNIASPVLRRIVSLQCVVVFFFNTMILALMVNIGAGLL